jgi:hypothetical protein
MFTAEPFTIAKAWKQLCPLMNKAECGLCTNRILFSLKKEGNSDTCYNTENCEDMMPSDLSQLQKTKCYMVLFTQ